MLFSVGENCALFINFQLQIHILRGLWNKHILLGLRINILLKGGFRKFSEYYWDLFEDVKLK